MTRKNAAIIKIISWSIVALALLALLLLGIVGEINVFSFVANTSYTYSNSSKYKAGNAEIDGDKVSDLEIDWLDGNIKVEVYDGNKVQLSEVSSRSLKENEKLHYYNDHGTLRVEYKKSERRLFSLGIKRANKELTVRLPESTAKKLGLLNIDTISSDTEVSDITTEHIRLDSTSGNFILNDCTAEKLIMSSTSGNLKGENLIVSDKINADTTSGNATLKGDFGHVEFDTVSGELYVESSICPEKIRTDTVSGDVKIVIPENKGFSYRKDAVSGSFQSDFQTKQKEDRGTYKDGSASFSFDTVSGDIEILKGE